MLQNAQINPVSTQHSFDESNMNPSAAPHNDCAMKKYLIFLEKILNFISLNRHHSDGRPSMVKPSESNKKSIIEKVAFAPTCRSCKCSDIKYLPSPLPAFMDTRLQMHHNNNNCAVYFTVVNK